MSGELVLGRGEYDITIATGKPPGRVTVTAEESEGTRAQGSLAGPGPVTLGPPRILHDGFAFRASVAVPFCRIVYQFAS